MKTAPAVTYPTGAPVAEYAVVAGLAAAWLVALAVWLYAYVQPGSGMPTAWWVLLVAGALLLGWSVWRLQALRSGLLVWVPAQRSAASPLQQTGSWTFTHPDWPRGLPLRRLRCALDFNQLMILELRSASGLGVWVWCSQARQPGLWLALRRAVHAVRHKDLHVDRLLRRN